MPKPTDTSQRGQALPLFALALTALILMVGLVIDAGYAFAQRRSSQNAADFAAIAGARIVGEAFTGKPAGAGTGQNVIDAINSVLTSNGAQLVSADYVNTIGAIAGTVASGPVPSDAAGVVVQAETAWRPFFLGVIGVTNWTAGAQATAMTKGLAAGGVLPIGIKNTDFNNFPVCAIDEGCDPENLTPGVLNDPGQFGWLSFGADTSFCNGYGLGQLDEGCEQSQGFLQNEIGPPGNSHGCCTDITLTPDAQRLIGGFTGNPWGDISWYVENKVPVWVPIWDYVNPDPGGGRNGYYHIVGFGAVLLTDAGTGNGEHAKWLKGIRLTDIGNTPNAFSLVGVTGEVYLVH